MTIHGRHERLDFDFGEPGSLVGSKELMNATTPSPKPTISPLRDFMRSEAAGGALLVAATVVALIWANSPWSASYNAVWDTKFSLALGRYGFTMDLGHWINDALMTIFFFVVGLEIKRETTHGHLASREKIMLPLLAALGGMVVPALTYLAIAGGESPRGWGVPMATDIALAVGLLTTLGNRVPRSLRAFLLGLAVVDDIAAIVVIAIFYSDGVSLKWLAYAGASLLVVTSLKKMNIQLIGAYLTAGTFLWFALHEAGVHATLAGVMMGLLTPNTPKSDIAHVDVDDHHAPAQEGSVSVLEWFEHLLHPWSAFVVVPLFALANAGIPLSSESISNALDSRVAWGVFVGLVIGKPLGVFLFSTLANKTQLARIPDDAQPIQLLGIGNAAGIGFTVALFISDLAFTSEQHKVDAKFAILAASTLSAVVALIVLSRASTRKT